MESERESIRVLVTLDADTFRRFMVFHYCRLNKSFRKPLLFCAFMTILAVVSFFGGKSQDVTAGLLMLAAGVALPAYYALRLYGMTQKGIRQNGLPRKAYELTLSASKVDIRSFAPGSDPVSLKWKELYHAYRVPGCIYLYSVPQRAFLLPDGQAENATADELWSWIETLMGPAKATDRR